MRLTDDSQCPFCNIFKDLSRKYYSPASYSSTLVREWESPSVAIIRPLSPVIPGHLLCMPKPHIIEHSDALAVGAYQIAARWASAHLEDFNLITSCGTSVTQTVAHVHFHIVPRIDNDGIMFAMDESRTISPHFRHPRRFGLN